MEEAALVLGKVVRGIAGVMYLCSDAVMSVLTDGSGRGGARKRRDRRR
ncbi:hypothetical protein LG634_17660 [Streptomyces bambusae]|nr:hypothetical protein [Streptomyces bambusae]MCB5166659.1 hypothetical protein [Streptomyces bambusae]